MQERESALQGWEGVELVTVVEWYVSGAKILDLLVENSISGRGVEQFVDSDR